MGKRNISSCVRTQTEGTVLCVKVQPRASRNEIGEAVGNELKVKVTAPPVDSAANEALVRFLAEALDCPRNSVWLTRGQTSRHKTILISGLDAEAVVTRLESVA